MRVTLWTLVTLIASGVLLGFGSPHGATAGPSQNDHETGTLEFPLLNGGGLVSFDFEMLRPSTDPLFAFPGPVFEHADGRLFWMDIADDDIKVLEGDTAEHLFTFGGNGEGPGEWLHAGAITLSAEGNVYVWDETGQRIHEFSGGDGSPMRWIKQLEPMRNVTSIVALETGDFLLAGLSFNPAYHGKLVHRLRPTKNAEGGWELLHVESFGEVPDFDAGLYLMLSGGLLATDGNGGFLTSLQSVHDLQHYVDGEPQWTLHDPDLMPDISNSLTLMPNGRVQVGPRAIATILTVAGPWVVHHVLMPPTGGPALTEPRILTPADIDASQIKIHRRYELIALEGPETNRAVFDAEDFIVRGADSSGRVYAAVGKEEATLIRGRFRFGPN